MDRLRGSVDVLADEVRRLREELRARPTREEVERARKLAIVRMVVAILWIVSISAFVQDQHLESCGAGARAENIVDALAAGEIQSPEDFNLAANRNLPGHCDVTAPLHSHDTTDWPTKGNVAGLAVYGALIVASAVLIRPRKWEGKVAAYGRPPAEPELVLPHEEGAPPAPPSASE